MLHLHDPLYGSLIHEREDLGVNLLGIASMGGGVVSAAYVHSYGPYTVYELDALPDAPGSSITGSLISNPIHAFRSMFSMARRTDWRSQSEPETTSTSTTIPDCVRSGGAART